jgi:hypothetical protein
VFFGIYKGQFWGVSSMSSSFNKLAGTMLAATAATLTVLAPVLESKATPNWEQEERAEELYAQRTSFLFDQNCLPKMEVSVDNNNRVIRIQRTGNSHCPIADEMNIFVQSNKRKSEGLPPLRLPAVRSQYQLDMWIAGYEDAEYARYRVKGIDPTPTGIKDNSYLTSGELGIDQVITIGVVESRHPVADPPPVKAEQPQQIITTLDSESKQPQQIITTLDSESKHLLKTFNQLMRWFQVNIWPQLKSLIRAIESIQPS